MPTCGHVAGAAAWVSSSSSWLLAAAMTTTRTTPTSCLFLHPSRGGIITPRRKLTLLQHPTHRTSRRTFLSQVGGDWEESWRRGTTPWDTKGAAPPLLNLLQRPSSPILPTVIGVSRALVPGAGSGYECMALAEAGWNVLGLDLAPTAVARAEALWEERQAKGGGGKGKGRLTYKVGNFNELDGRFDLIFDYTFLCALPPDHRPRWAKKMRELLTPQTGQLITLIFPVHDSSKTLQSLNLTDGPPFEVTPGLYRHLLLGEEEGGREGGREGGFTCLELTGPLADSISPRKGREWLGRWAVREEGDEERKEG